MGVIAGIAGWLESFQGETLVAAGKWLAGGAVTLAALGARFTQTFGRLRVAIDAVLDIDNYFGDPPNRQPPRGRIFSRYASLLAYLREQRYARVVIVSHSQGTVISADLLRYLHVHGRLQGLLGARPVALVTLGSPLRGQLSGSSSMPRTEKPQSEGWRSKSDSIGAGRALFMIPSLGAPTYVALNAGASRPA